MTARPPAARALARSLGKTSTKAANGADLPPHEREEALQQIAREFPPHYREVIEHYFKRLASGDDSP